MVGLRQNYKHEGNDLLQGSVILIMNSLYGVQNRKNIEFFECISQNRMETEYDDNVLDYWRLAYGNYIMKLKHDDESDDENNVKNTLVSHLGVFILANSKRITKSSIREINRS